MQSTPWIVLAVIAVIVIGILSGVAGLLFAPIIGGIALVAIIVWLLQRWARNKPPVE
jgi:predicted PurR-regulated permease PerM